MTSTAEVQLMLSTMLSKVGDGYTESIPQRFGTTNPQMFDCSGLVWYAASNAGIPMPGGPTNDVAALVTNEIVWLSRQLGAELVLSASDVQAGDIIAFTGGDPVPFSVIIGGVVFPPGEFGHIGMAVSPTEYVSAYDTAEGVCVKPIAGDVFNVAVRLTSGVLPMTITMYDSTSPAAIPASAQLVAAYVDGYGGYSAAVSRFGANKVISISVGNNNADVADVETGAMTPIQLPGWVARQVARGVPRPVVYCNQSTWPLCQNALGKTNVSWWIADPGGSGVIAGADAVQNVWEGAWDSSVVQPTFPFYTGATPQPAGPVFPIVAGDSGSAVTTVQNNLNKWAVPIKLTPKLVVDGDFGADTLAAVRDALRYFDYSAANVSLGHVDQSLWNHLAAAPPVIKPPTPTPPPTPPPAATTLGRLLYIKDGALVDTTVTSTNLTTWLT